MDCIFCKIAKHELPTTTIFEDDKVAAFNDINPKAPLHILVIPKEHIQSIAHLESDHNEILAKIIYTARHLAAERGLGGYKLVFNVGREGGQVIDHLHLHLLGGWGSTESEGNTKQLLNI